MAEFKRGKTFCSGGVFKEMIADEAFEGFVHECIDRFFDKDWGDTKEIEALVNEESIKNGGPVFAVYIYPHDGRTIWIQKDADSNYVMIVFPIEEIKEVKANG